MTCHQSLWAASAQHYIFKRAMCLSVPALTFDLRHPAVVAAAGASEEHYQEVVEALAEALEPLTDDWYSLHNALQLLEFLLPRCPLLAAEFIAAPYLVRQLLGYWAEDATGRDCGAVVRARAASILGSLEDMELQRLRLERLVRPSHRADNDPRRWCRSVEIWGLQPCRCST